MNGGSGPTVTQSCGKENYGTSVTCSSWTGTGSVTAGDIVIVQMMAYAAGATLPTNPTGCGITFSQINSGTDSNSDAWSWNIGSVPSTTACTLTITGSGASGGVTIQAWDANNVIATSDGTCSMTYQATSSSPVSGPSITTSTSGDLILASYASDSGSPTATINSPFTQDYNGGAYFSLGHDVQASSGSITPAWTISGFYDNLAGICAVKP